MSVETPEYDVLRREGQFELRRYRSYLTASVAVTASSYEQATNAGFEPPAGYIFGANHTSDRISMTAPVSAGRVCCQKIAMTAPVTVTEAQDAYVVSFTMPSGYSMDDLPRPNDPAVTLKAVDSHLVAAVRFSGYLHDATADRARSELEAWMQQEGLSAVGDAVVAQYDPPWRPIARHNEMLIPVAEDSAGPAK